MTVIGYEGEDEHLAAAKPVMRLDYAKVSRQIAIELALYCCVRVDVVKRETHPCFARLIIEPDGTKFWSVHVNSHDTIFLEKL